MNYPYLDFSTHRQKVCNYLDITKIDPILANNLIFGADYPLDRHMTST
ncbi:hypothetical protein [Chamaesiphon polymorphus]|nr:hypothetical protein [Chamaesiphon polymorphus]